MEKIVNFRPIIFLALSLCLGILSAFGIAVGKIYILIVSGVVFLAGAVYFVFFYPFEKSLKSKLLVSVIFIAVFIFGFINFTVKINGFRNADLYSHYYAVTGKVVKANTTDYGVYTVVDNVKLDGIKKGASEYKISLYVYGESEIDVGDEISFYTVLYDNPIYYADKFSADRIDEKIKYTARVDCSEIEITGKSLNFLERVNLFIRDTLKTGLGEDEFPVAYAMLTGDSGFIDDYVLENYRSVGVAHIFAVSGLHIGLLAFALGFVLDKLKINKAVKTLTVFAVCLFYSGVCGFSASSVRATVMCAVLYFCNGSGEKYDGLSSVGIACFTVLTYSPIQLFRIGFELSFAVVIGIIVLSRPVSKIFRFLPKKIASSLGSVISAQAVSIPLCITAFGSFSAISVLANLLFLPFTGFIYILLIVSTVIGGLFSIESVCLIPSNYIFKFVNMLITAFDYKIFVFGGIVIGAFSVFYYVALLVPSGILNLKSKIKRVVSLICATVCIIGVSTLSVSEYLTPKIYACGSDGVCATLITKGKTSVLTVANFSKFYTMNALRRISDRTGIEKVDAVILLNYSVDLQILATKISSVFDVDNLIYYGEIKYDSERIMKKSFPKIKCVAVPDDGTAFGEFGLRYSLEGRCVEGEINGEKFAFIGETVKGKSSFHGLTGKYKFITAYNGLDSVYAEYKPETLISYRNGNGYPDCETNGYFTYKFR